MKKQKSDKSSINCNFSEIKKTVVTIEDWLQSVRYVHYHNLLLHVWLSSGVHYLAYAHNSSIEMVVRYIDFLSRVHL